MPCVAGRWHGPAGPAACRVRWHEGTFFSREPQALEDTAHGGHTETQPSPVVEMGAEFLQGRIGLLADELAHQRQRHRVAARLAPPGMRPWSNFSGRAPSSQQLLEKRAADTK